MGDAHTKRLTTFCGIEVKKEFQDIEARTKSATWMAAGFSWIRILEALAGKAPQDQESLLGWMVVGYRWTLHIVYQNPMIKQDHVTFFS